MASVAEVPAVRTGERKFFLFMAAAMLVTVLIGFGPTYYFLPWSDAVTVRGVAASEALTPLVHLHGLVFSAWILLFMSQASLIALDRFALHRASGIAGVALAAAMVAIGLWTAIASGRAGSTPPGWANAEAFLIMPFSAIALFAGFFVAAILNRHRPDYHKRLMLLAMIALMVPALARIMRIFQPPFLPPGVFGALLVVNLYLAALVAYDLGSRGRLHRATIWGGGIMLVAWPARFLIGESGPWQAFAHLVLG